MQGTTDDDEIKPLAPLNWHSTHWHMRCASWRVMCDIPLHKVSFTLMPHKLHRKFQGRKQQKQLQKKQKVDLRHSSSTPAPFMTWF